MPTLAGPETPMRAFRPGGQTTAAPASRGQELRARREMLQVYIRLIPADTRLAYVRIRQPHL